MGMKFTFRGMEFSLLREMAAFTFFIFLNQIIDQVNWSVDKFLLGRMAGTTAVAVYGIGGQINSLYIQVSTSISSVFAPQIHKMVASSDCDKELTQLMIRVGRVQFFPVMLVFTGFLLFGQSFIRMWAGEGYQESYLVALLLMLPMIVPLIQNIGIEIQRAKNMHRFRSIVYTCMAGSNLLLSIVLVYKWGSIGAAAGTTFTLFVSTAVFMNWYYHKRIGLDMRQFWKSIAGFIPAIMVSLAFGAVYCCIVDVKGWLSLVVSVLMYTVVYATAMWFLAMNQYEKELVMRLIAKSIRKIR
jgi:O-antigen/teichoic acid export membrane protein